MVGETLPLIFWKVNPKYILPQNFAYAFFYQFHTSWPKTIFEVLIHEMPPHMNASGVLLLTFLISNLTFITPFLMIVIIFRAFRHKAHYSAINKYIQNVFIDRHRWKTVASCGCPSYHISTPAWLWIQYTRWGRSLALRRRGNFGARAPSDHYSSPLSTCTVQFWHLPN